MAAADQALSFKERRVEIYAAFKDAYRSYVALQRMLYLRLNRNLETEAGQGPLDDVIYRLLFDRAEVYHWLPELLKAACDDQPRHEALRTVALQIGIELATASEQASTAREGLEALSVLIHEPAWRDAVANCRAALAGAERKIHLVADLKDLHDYLHDLQHKCLLPLRACRAGFPESADIQLQVSVRSLKRYMNECCKVVERGRLTAVDLPWIEENLKDALSAFERAGAAGSRAEFDLGIACLEEVISTQPTSINSRLVQAVRDLDLLHLTQNLRELSAVPFTRAQPDLRRRFELGLSGLEQITQRLDGQIRDHQDWQRIDNQLRLLLTTVGGPFEDIEPLWAMLERRVLTACGRSREPWSEELQSATGMLKQAIERRERNRLAVFVPEFATLASDRFYSVDKQLKALCEELRPLGARLDAILDAT
jgi:hypothetical protein